MNKKIAFAGIAVVLLCVSLSFSGPKKAVLITDGMCTMFDGDGNLVKTEDVKIVVTNSAKGNVVMKCKAQGLENNQGSAVHWDAFENPMPVALDADPSPVACGTVTPEGVSFTEDWMIVVSEKGNAMMTCRFKADD